MGDVAQILGISTAAANNNNSKHGHAPPDAPSSHSIPRSIQNASALLSKPVLKILSGKIESQNHAPSSSSLPPIVPSHNLTIQSSIKKRRGGGSVTGPGTTMVDNTTAGHNSSISFVKIHNKCISTKKARSWIYAPFSNSARKDGLLLHHWVRAGLEYPDYPYARFDIHLDELSYRNEVLEIENANNSRNDRERTDPNRAPMPVRRVTRVGERRRRRSVGARRGSGFSEAEVMSLLASIHAHLPISGDEWRAVQQEHHTAYPDADRTVESLRRKFASLHRSRIPTGDPTCPAEVREAM